MNHAELDPMFLLWLGVTVLLIAILMALVIPADAGVRRDKNDDDPPPPIFPLY